MPLRTAAAALLALLLAVPAGCGGDGAADGPTVTLRVTRDFGRDPLVEEDSAPIGGNTKVLELLEAHADVSQDKLNLFVEEINGLRLRTEAPAFAWALNVNGIEADVRSKDYRVYPGDVIQFDHRYWYVTLDVRATVGAFPQTFTRGVFGRRFPVAVRCEKPKSGPCLRVKRTLRAAGVDVDGEPPKGKLPRRGLPRRASVLVGRWSHWRDRPWPHRIDEGPRYSGVFARFSPEGDELRLQDWYAHRARAEGAGTGLVAAMRPTEEDVMWLVTGVDDVGVARAARALNTEDLRDAFAVVVTDQGVQRIPLVPRGRSAPSAP